MFLSFIVAVCLPLAQAQAADGSLGDNAALQYWQAFSLMPAADRLSEKEKKALEQWQSIPLDAAAVALVDKYRSALDYLRYGAGFSRCDWGLAPALKNDGIGAALPHLEKARDLSRAACLRARHAFSQGKHRAAFDDLYATLVLARHAGADGTMMSLLVGYAIERQVIELTAARLTKGLDVEALKKFQARLAELPPVSTLGAAVRKDRDMYVAWIRGRGLKAVESLIEDLHKADDERKEVIRGFLGLEEKNLPALCEALGKVFDEAARIAALPLEECEDAEKAFKKKLEDEFAMTDPLILNVFPRLVLPAVSKMRSSEAQAETRRALFRAALASVLEGPEKAKDFRDPHGDGPFIFRKLEKGFELTSKLKDAKGQPVTLAVGTSE